MSDPRAGLRRLQSQPEGLAELCRRHGVVLVSAFGSAVRGHGEPADLDLAVLFDRDLGQRDILGVIADLTDLIGLQHLDVTTLNGAGPVVRERALVGATLLYESHPGVFAHEQISAMLERMDTDWLRRSALAGMTR